MSSEATGASSESRDPSLASSGTLQASPSVILNPPAEQPPSQSPSQTVEPPPASPAAASGTAVDAHSLAAVAQLAPDIDEGVDAWPCTHCAQRHATFSKWNAEREVNKRESALRRAREAVMKLPEVKTAFPLDRTRFPISRKYGKRVRDVYKSCHSEWLYLHERKPNLKPMDPDMNRPLSPDDFKFFSGGSSPGPSSAESPPIGISPQATMGSPQAVSCAVAKDAHRRYPIYVSRASSSTSENVSVSQHQTKPRSTSVSSRSDVSANRVRPIRSPPSSSVIQKSPRTSIIREAMKTSPSPKLRSATEEPKSRESSQLLQPPSPTIRKKRSTSKTMEAEEHEDHEPPRETGRPKKGKGARKKKPNRWPDCCKAQKCKDASMCMCEDYEWINRRGRNRIPTPQCWCEYYEMLKEIYQMMNNEIKRKKMLKKERKEKAALEAEVRCKLLQEEKARRLKKLRKRRKARRTAVLRIDSEGAAANPKYPCAPWMTKLAREIALSEARFENPAFRQAPTNSQDAQKSTKPIPPLETDTQVTSVLKEIALMLKQDQSKPALQPAPTKVLSSNRHWTLSDPVRIEQPPSSPPRKPRDLKREPSESPPNLIGGDEIVGTDYIVSGTSVSIPQTPIPTPPATPPQQASPRRETTPPKRVEPPRKVPVQSVPPTKQEPSKAPIKWQYKGGRSNNSAVAPAGQSYSIAPSQPISNGDELLNFRLTRGPQRDQLQQPLRPPQTFNSQVRHARAVLTPPAVSPASMGSADEGASIQSPTVSVPTPLHTPATGEVVQLQPHSSYVGYNVPAISVPARSKNSHQSPPKQSTAFTIVQPSSLPDCCLGDRSAWVKPESSSTGENAFRIVSPAPLQASVGGDWDGHTTDHQSEIWQHDYLAPPKVFISHEDEREQEETDYHHFEPHGDFFYLRNLGDGVKFYRRQIFKDVARRKKRSRTTR